MRFRRGLLAVAALACAACAPARADAPPDAELILGSVGPSTTAVAVDADETITQDVPDEPRVEAPPEAEGTAATVSGVTGWAAFDRQLEQTLIGGGDTSASVAVSIGGEIVHTAAFGVRAAGDTVVVDRDDRFRIASISKVVTAIVTLQLVDDGLLALDEPVGGRLGALLGVTPTDPDLAQVTVEHLLSHTSAIGSHDNLFFGNGAATCADAARTALTGRVGTPGGFSYSNMNYCLLGLLIEEATGQGYEHAVYERLLTPLGIEGMRLAGTYDVGPDEVTHFSAPNRTYMEALAAAGAWVASPSDLVTILDSVDPANTGWRPLSDAMLVRMRTPPFGRPAGGSWYGLGLINYGAGAYGHTGTLESTHAMVMSRPDGVTWAVTVNGEYPGNTERLSTIVDTALTAAFPAS